MAQQSQRSVGDLVYVGFNKQVVALDRYTGELAWRWHAPKGSGFVALLLDGDRLIASTQGYMYCLDPLYGQEVWSNPLEGMGVGVPCLASLRGGTNASQQMSSAAEIVHQQQQAAAAAAAS